MEKCPFCGKRAVTESSQGVPVCLVHKSSELLDLKCVCGEWLDIRKGKYGPYFHCMNCGNISWRKGMEINPGAGEEKEKMKKEEKEKKSNRERGEGIKETIITSREVDAYYS